MAEEKARGRPVLSRLLGIIGWKELEALDDWILDETTADRGSESKTVRTERSMVGTFEVPIWLADWSVNRAASVVCNSSVRALEIGEGINNKVLSEVGTDAVVVESNGSGSTPSKVQFTWSAKGKVVSSKTTCLEI